MKTYVVYDATADRVYLVKAENETEASAKLRASITPEQMKAEFQSLCDLIIGINKDIEHTNKYVDEQLSEGRECCLKKRELIELPVFEEYVADYEIETQDTFELTEDITLLHDTVLVNYF